MSVKLPPLLVVDDEKNMRLSLEAVMAEEGYEIRAVDAAEAALRLLEQEEFFMIITDARLNGMSGYEFLGQLKQRWPNLPVLMITAFATPKLAVEAIKAGAIDYLSKPFAPEELLHAVARCAERHRLILENQELRARAGEPYRLDQIIGESPKVRELRQLIQTVAPTNATVLILGESGTGKELIAGALHTLSQRSAAHYVRINCAAIPETLLESELFGHEKGAFTGALRQKQGRVEEADEGTIFRDDLYHRLNVVQFRPAALRERGEDIPVLADHFLKQFRVTLNKPIRAISKPAQQLLMAHHWPGNVRELRNVIERAVILEKTEEIQPTSLPDFHLETRLRKDEYSAATSTSTLEEALFNFERDLILSRLEQHHFTLAKTADQLKITRHALRYRMQRLNINIDAGPDEDTVVPVRKDFNP